ncbi:hypothetical protein CASFOL_012362 [Castilleja foliolosa]|uniref:MATH domain-containing protein n=1 Tax=Castilleja foliolosa TaxID=1961234 RepID=A0ABD3DHL4_9LAMI
MYLAQVAADEVDMETREASPAHYLVKIDSFSLHDQRGINKIETTEFTAGNYKWRLVIHPNGHGTERDVDQGYVSVYLAIAAGSDDLPSNWEVNATFSICLFNHFSGNYIYSLGRARRFHALKQEWGFMKFISMKDLTDPSNGYIVNDKCVFGAEVFVNENKAVIECMSLKSVDTYSYKQEFKVTNFSSLKEKWISEEFTAGGHKWTIDVYLNGNGENIGRCLSIYLRHVVSIESVRPCFTIRLKNQSSDDRHPHHHEKSSSNWFTATNSTFGWTSFIELSSLKDPNRGFIVNDCCVIEVELALQAMSS